MTDPLLAYFDQLDALLCALARADAPGDETKQREIIAWGWFCLVTDPLYLQVCLQTIGVLA
jgi:hypothetical protein